MKNQRPTSFDIAFRAGVSQSTVSRALRDSPQVSKATRERIQAIAKELNYRVDKHATALRSQSSSTLALLIFEDATPDQSHINPFFLSMLGHVTREASRHNFDLLVSFQQMDQDWHLEYELSSKADGLILLGYGNDFTSYNTNLARLANDGAHIILWGPHLPDIPVPTIGTDNMLGGAFIAQHLLDLGHRSVTFIGNTDAGSPEFAQRYAGLVETLTKGGVKRESIRHIDAESSDESATIAAKTLLQKPLESSAIVCASDLIAINVLKHLKLAGYSVPNQVSLSGFDDIGAASWVEPALTTVRQDTKLSGELLVQGLLAQIRGEASASVQVIPKLVTRNSTGAAQT